MRATPAIALGLLALALCALAGGGQATTVASLAVEDGSSVLFENDTIIIDGSLGGPHAGRILVANTSTLTLNNITLSFVNGTADGGIWVGSSSLLIMNASTATADPSSRFAVTVTGAATLDLRQTSWTGLQVTEDISAAAIAVDAGSTFRAMGVTLRVRPDVRPLVDVIQGELDWTSCDVTGAIRLAQSTATLRALTQRVIGETIAIDAVGSTVTLSNSTIDAAGGAWGVAASSLSSVTIRSTNLTAEDVAVSAETGATVTLRDVVAQAGSDLSGPVGDFGLVAEGAAIVGTNVAVIGFPTALWLKNADATLTGVQLGGGIVRLNGSRASIDRSPALTGIVFVEATSTLTLTDTGVDWQKVDVTPPSEVVIRYRPTFEFFTSSLAPAAGANWSVFAAAGPFVANGTAGSDGTSEGPPLEGPHFRGTRFDPAPSYRIQITHSSGSLNTTITAWGEDLRYPFFLDPTLGDLAFEAPLVLSEANPAEGSQFTISGRLTLVGAAGPVGISVRLVADGTALAVRTITVSSSAPATVSFNLTAAAGWHIVGIRADLEGGARGSFFETNEVANNALYHYYNASAGNATSVKPDLVVTPDAITFELLNATAVDPVTGEPRDARRLAVTVHVRNLGLTAAGPFDVVVAVGTRNERTSITGIAAGGTANVTLNFGPYIDTQDILVLATLDFNDRIDEGNEGNNRAEASAHVELPIYIPPPRPLWVTLLVLAGAGGLVAMSAWGVLLVFRRGDEDADAETPPPKGDGDPAKPAAAAASPVSAGSAVPPKAAPGSPAAPAAAAAAPTTPLPTKVEALAASTPPPTAPAPPPPMPAPQQRFPTPMPPHPLPGPPPTVEWPPPAYYNAPPPFRSAFPPAPPAPGAPGSRYTPPPGAPGQNPARPPARCLKCGSTQVTYVLAPERIVTCSTCGAKDTF